MSDESLSDEHHVQPFDSKLLRRRWRKRLDAADLPDEVKSIIARIVRRSRLWKREKEDVAMELIAHFSDGIEKGISTEHAIDAFGDVRTAAKLIRRAKLRNRPLLWHIWRWGGRAIELLLFVYGIFFLRFYSGRPHATVDYAAQLNAPILSVPVDQRAWPVYREAILQMNIMHGIPPCLRGDDRYPLSPDAIAWLTQHRDAIKLVRQAASKPILGFLFGPDGSWHDPALGITGPYNAIEPLSTAFRPEVWFAVDLARVLLKDARMQSDQGDGAAACADLEAVGKLFWQWQTPFVAARLRILSIANLWLMGVQQNLVQHPAIFNDDALQRTAHQIALLKRDQLFANLIGSRLRLQDFLQRAYTSDDDGNGRLTPAGLKLLQQFAPRVGESSEVFITLQSGLSFSSPRHLLAEYDRIMSEQFADLRKPLRDADATTATARKIAQIHASPSLQIKEYPLIVFLPNMDSLSFVVERIMVQRDAALCGLALEAYRRRHGAYPTRIEALVPEYLPVLPEDPVTGEPVKYILKDGRPCVYSVGADRRDNQGMPPMSGGKTLNRLEESWRYVPSKKAVHGDWVLYPPTE